MTNSSKEHKHIASFLKVEDKHTNTHFIQTHDYLEHQNISKIIFLLKF